VVAHVGRRRSAAEAAFRRSSNGENACS
jgi:hypothetical protein